MRRFISVAAIIACSLSLSSCDAADMRATPAASDGVTKQEAIETALRDYARTKDLPHSSYEEPDRVAAYMDTVLADADDAKERVWVVRMELSGGAEEGAYIGPQTGEVLGGWSGSP